MAVKVVAHDCSIASLAETLRESALSTSIQHPNVVRGSSLVMQPPGHPIAIPHPISGRCLSPGSSMKGGDAADA